MSRIGKKPIVIPEAVKVSVEENQVVVEGPKGVLKQKLVPGVVVEQEEDRILVRRLDDQRTSRANQGMIRAILANMLHGVHQGFEKVLEITGVGYKAEVSGDELSLHLGYSHRVVVKIPEQVDVVAEKPTRIIVRSIDRQKVGQVAAIIRASRIPDPYKGKGITYEGEKILRKAGKKAVS